MHKQAMHELCVAAPCLSRSCWCHMPCPGWLWRPGCCMVATCRTTEIFFARCCWQCLGCLLLMASGQNCSSGCRVCVPLCPEDKRLLLQQRRPGCCCVPEPCAHEIFCCMLFAVSFLLTSNGQRLKMLPRLLCVPARLLPASGIPPRIASHLLVTFKRTLVASHLFFSWPLCFFL